MALPNAHGPPEELAALGTRLWNAFGTLCEDLEDRRRRAADAEAEADVDLQQNLAAVGEEERAAGHGLERKRRRLQSALQSLHTQKEELLDSTQRQLSKSTWLDADKEFAYWEALGLVQLTVGGRPFLTTSASLQRSPWFARHLAGSSRARRLVIERDPTRFGLILEYLRQGPGCLRSLAFLSREERASLAEDAASFELPCLAGALAEPPVGQRVSASLPSWELAAACTTAVLLHDRCGSWHVAGRCYDPLCRSSGSACVTATVTGWSPGRTEPTWTLEWHGSSFLVRRSQLTDRR